MLGREKETLDSVGGVFVELLAGMGVACVSSVLEFSGKGKSKAKDSSMVMLGLAQPRSNNLSFKFCGDRGLWVRLAYPKMRYDYYLIL